MRALALALVLATPLGALCDAELLASEHALQQLLVKETPDPIRLWLGQPPQFAVGRVNEPVGRFILKNQMSKFRRRARF